MIKLTNNLDTQKRKKNKCKDQKLSIPREPTKAGHLSPPEVTKNDT